MWGWESVLDRYFEVVDRIWIFRDRLELFILKKVERFLDSYNSNS